MYSEIVRSPQFYFDEKGEFFPEATTFIMTGRYLRYLYNLFHSHTITYLFKRFYAGGGLGEDGYRYKKAFFEKLPIPKCQNSKHHIAILNANEESNIENDCYVIFDFSNEEIQFIESQ